MAKHIAFFEDFTNEMLINKSVIDNINTMDDFINVVNTMDKTPQRGFSYKVGSAKKITTKSILMHSTTEENIKGIVANGFRGVGAYYSSFTKNRNKETHITNGIFGFAFNSDNKKVDSVLQKGFLYGSYVLLFTSDNACNVYNTLDKQPQVVFDVTSNINILAIVRPRIDKNVRYEYIWDVYDKELNLIERDVKLTVYLKEIKKYLKEIKKFPYILL